jgi:hypothetical protein
MATGTHSIKDLLAIKFQSVKAYGMNTIQEVVQNELQVHNELATEMVDGLCEVTTDAQRIYGTNVEGSMVKVDEFGRAPTQKQDVGDTVGFPLERYQFAIGWTEDWFEKKTPADLALAVIGAEQAHKRALIDNIKYALFRSANYTFRDYLVDYVSLSVKRLVNADSAKIPNGPFGLAFDGSTHTHYLANATLTTAALDSALLTVREHGHGNGMQIAINFADEASFRGLSGFVAYLDPRIIASTSSNNARGTLDTINIYDRKLGIYNGAEVVVKPWVPQNYCFVWAADDGKPLAFRQEKQESLQGLRIPAMFSAFPLVAEYMQAEFGVGVWNRTNGAVLRFNNGTYADPF